MGWDFFDKYLGLTQELGLQLPPPSSNGMHLAFCYPHRFSTHLGLYHGLSQALGTLITTLPRSVKAVKEILLVLFKGGVLQHAIDLIKRGSGQCVPSHADLAAESRSIILQLPRDSANTAYAETRETRHDHHHHGRWLCSTDKVCRCSFA